MKINKFLTIAVFFALVLSACDKKQDDNTFTDPRDGQTYRMVKIGDLTWMAQNLNYDVPETDADVCFDGNPNNCAKYGRLYYWAMAMGMDTSYNGKSFTAPVNHQGICPPGWRVPNGTEWDNLAQAAGGNWMEVQAGNSFFYWENAGEKLKSKIGWKDYKDKDAGNGTDDFGFSALPGGYYDACCEIKPGNKGSWWSSTDNMEEGPELAWSMLMNWEDNNVYRYDQIKKSLFSLRCVQGAELAKPVKQPEQNDIKSGQLPEPEHYTEHEIKHIPPVQGNQFNPGIEYSVLTDPRDEQKYRSVKIGKSTWMAQNLNFETDNSWCCGNDESHCAAYGRLYSWNAAMSACPAGWRLANDDDWNNLFKLSGGKLKKIEDFSGNCSESFWSVAGGNLKSKIYYNGKDKFGFSAMLGGIYNRNATTGEKGYFSCGGHEGVWWSATGSAGNASYYKMSSDEFTGMTCIYADEKSNGYSVRCVKE